MFKRLVNKITVNEQEMRENLYSRSEKELIIEVKLYQNRYLHTKAPNNTTKTTVTIHNGGF